MGIPDSTFRGWLKKYANLEPAPKNKDEEILRLKRELAQVKMERDLLKKVTAIFSRESR